MFPTYVPSYPLVHGEYRKKQLKCHLKAFELLVPEVSKTIDKENNINLLHLKKKKIKTLKIVKFKILLENFSPHGIN